MKVKGWTDGRFQGFIINLLRRGMIKYPNKFDCLKAARVGRLPNKATGRLAEHYQCKKCKNSFIKNDVQVDHKKPVVDPKDGFVDWNTYIDRLFCEPKNLQVLCKACHKVKTQKEKLKRTRKK